MRKKSFSNMFLTSFLGMISMSLLMMFFWCWSYNDIKFINIKDNAILIKNVIDENDDYSLLESIVLKDVEIAVISSDGMNIFDSIDEPVKDYKNSSDFINALEIGVSESKIYSKEHSSKIYSYFLRLSNGNVLLLTTKALSIINIFDENKFEIIAAFLFTLLFSYIISKILSKRFAENIKVLTENIDNTKMIEYYDELYPFVRKIQSQQNQIQCQIDKFKKERDRVSIITENMQEGLIILDNNQRVISLNSSAKSILKLKNENFLGKHILKVTRNHTINQVVVNVYSQSMVDSVLEQNNKFYKIHGCHVKYDGQDIGAILLFVDITSIELEAKRRKEFTSNVSHELKTPLTSILGYSELLYNDIAKDNDKKVFTSKIIQESKHMISLIEDIMILSKLDETYYVTDTEDISLKSIVQEVFNRLERQSSEKNITLNFLGDNITFKSSKYMLSQIIFNLVDNAIKYNNDNGKVDICCNFFSNQLEIVVSDTGFGIETIEQERIFERFYRIEKSRNKFTGGTGLGLSIVKNMVSRLNGEIKIVSTIGKGTQITVILNINYKS